MTVDGGQWTAVSYPQTLIDCEEAYKSDFNSCPLSTVHYPLSYE